MCKSKLVSYDTRAGVESSFALVATRVLFVDVSIYFKNLKFVRGKRTRQS
jgi:hypothetical protein